MKLAEVFSKAATALEGSEFSQGFADARPGTMCAGQAIEAVAGMPLGRYLDERIFAPLGMVDTAFTVPPDKVARYAKALPTDPVTGAAQKLRDGTRPHKFDCGGGCAISCGRR